MKKIAFIFLAIFVFSCTEKLLEEPENLIPKEKMIQILSDLAILNAAKTNNAAILRKYDIEPMNYIFNKYNIDSLQFVESDRYYASMPEEHEKIYIEVEAKLEKEKTQMAEEKKIRDSLKLIERKAKSVTKKINDSLLKTARKKSEL